MGTFSIWHWLVVLLVVVLVFGSGKLAEVGSNVGKAIRGFQKSMRDGEKAMSAGEKKPSLGADSSASESESVSPEKTASS